MMDFKPKHKAKIKHNWEVYKICTLNMLGDILTKQHAKSLEIGKFYRILLGESANRPKANKYLQENGISFIGDLHSTRNTWFELIKNQGDEPLVILQCLIPANSTVFFSAEKKIGITSRIYIKDIFLKNKEAKKILSGDMSYEAI